MSGTAVISRKPARRTGPRAAPPRKRRAVRALHAGLAVHRQPEAQRVRMGQPLGEQPSDHRDGMARGVAADPAAVEDMTEAADLVRPRARGGRRPTAMVPSGRRVALGKAARHSPSRSSARAAASRAAGAGGRRWRWR